MSLHLTAVPTPASTTPVGSDPAWVTGYVPPATEWNLWWGKKLDVTDPVVANGPFMSLSGGTMLGSLTLAGPPVLPLDAATKAYVDAITPAAGPFMSQSGGVFTGNVTFATGARLYISEHPPLDPGEAIRKDYADAISVAANNAATTANAALPKAGGTMTGPLLLAADPTNAFGAATKQYVDRFVPLSGGTMTGTLATTSAGDINSGRNVYAANTLFVSSFGSYEWAFYSNTNADKVEQFRPQWYNLWSGSTGQRQWNGPGGNLMYLNGTGDLGVQRDVSVGRNLTAAGFVNANASLQVQGAWTFSIQAGTAHRIQSYSSGWYDLWNASTGVRNWVGPSGTLAYLNASGQLAANNGIYATPDLSFGLIPGGTRDLQFSSGWGFVWDPGNGNLYWKIAGTLSVYIRGGDQSLIVQYGQGYKPGGGAWADTSDSRVKDIGGHFTTGLAAILKLQPVKYKFKSSFKDLDEREFVGLVAQDVEDYVPEAVTQTTDIVDGQELSDVRVLDMTPVLYAMLNAIKELASRVSALEAPA